MAFDDVRLPVDIEKGAVGGPSFNTTIVELASGNEQRNQMWSRERVNFDVAYGIQSKSDFDAVRSFFKARRGKARGFRFKDWSDYIATDSVLGTGDGVAVTGPPASRTGTAVYQLIKVYADTANAYTRKITRPVSGTLSVKVAGVLKTEGTHYSVDYSTGIVTFVTLQIPLLGEQITASFNYDIPVRFDVDALNVTVQTENAFEVRSIQIKEVLE